MDKINQEAFIYHSKTNYFNKKVYDSLLFIKNIFNGIWEDYSGIEWYVAFSGGKDSTVVFDLVQKYNPTVLAIWSDDEFYLPETRDYMERMKHSGANIIQSNGPAKHTEWFVSNKNSNEPDMLSKANEFGCGGVFLGLRAEENNYRKIYLRKNGLLFFSKKHNSFQCNPVAWWTVQDIWAYIVSRKIDYNKAYDIFSKLGVSIEKQRIGPYATEKALGYGQLAILKMGWPDEYRKFLIRFPEACMYA